MKCHYLALLLCAFFQFICEQTQGQGQSLAVSPEEGPFFIINNGDEVRKIKSHHAHAEPSSDHGNKKYIVEFKEAPFFLKKKKKQNAAVQDYQAHFTGLQRDLNNLHRGRKSKAEPKIRKQFHKVFFGAEVELTEDLAKALRKLAYVKNVSEVRRVEAILDNSVAMVKADQVWAQYGNKGEGITIGIIDTGIDYNHPALGAGFGAAYKVTGGYDFVNHDSDPMDDHGHGTHCAGIVAADGSTLQGVAPHANLVALKVLGAAGWGFNTDIIAAIEWAADPDQNGDDSDKLDILSLSLGGPGDPDDAQSAAVDHAVELGIVFCVAEGNSYNNFKISSPGTARDGITIGAVNNSGDIAGFSSKGPNTKILSIKPEIVAPGVDINSTHLNGSFASFSGTSMATPHIAGIAALLRSIHPGWTPGQIKSALMSSATDLGEEATSQGAGLVNALRAARAKTFAEPAHVSFGMMAGGGVQVKYDTLNVFNSDTIPKSYTATVSGAVDGLAISAFPTSFSVAPGAAQQVVITASADHAILPIPERPSGTYSGKIVLAGTYDTLALPWAVVKSGRILFTFDTPYPDLWISSASGLNNNIVYGDDGYTGETYMHPGEADILYVSDYKTLIFRENVLLTGNDSIHFSESEGIHTLTLQPVDHNGQPLLGASQYFNVEFPQRSAAKVIVTSMFVPDHEFKISPFSDRFQLITGHRRDQVAGANTIHSIQHPTLHGFAQSITFANAASDYISQDIEIVSAADTLFKMGVGMMFSDEERFYSGLYYFTGNFTGSWKGKLYQSKTDPQTDQFPAGLWAVPMDYPLESQTRILSTPPLVASGNGIGASETSPVRPITYVSPSGGSMTFGKGIFYPNAPSTSRITELQFYGQLNETLDFERGLATYKLFNESGAVVDSGNLNSLTPGKLLAGKNHLEVSLTPSRPENTPGTGTYTAKFDLSNGDQTSLFMNSFQILGSHGVPSDTLERGAYNAIRFSIAPTFRETHLFVKAHGAQTWRELPMTRIAEETSGYSAYGFLYEANLVSFDTVGPIDVKITATTQAAGNQMEWKLERAFVLEDLLHPVIEVAGAGTPIPYGSVYDFGGVIAGQSTSPILFTVQNTGQDPLNLPRTPILRLSSGNPAFTIDTDATARDLQTGEATTFTVTFTAQQPGIITDTLWIASNADMHNPFKIILRGSCLGPEVQMKIMNTPLLSGSTYDYGSVVVGSVYVRTFTIENIGSAPLDLSGTPKLQVAGDVSSFTINQQNLPAAIAPGSSASFTLQFKPLTPGNKTITVTMDNNDSDEHPYAFTINGKGVTGDINLKYAGADVTQNTTMALGTALPGQSSSTHTFTIENLGDHALTFSTNKISIYGANQADFAVNFGSMPQSLPIGQSTSFTITFSPTAGDGGNRTAEVWIGSNDYDESLFKFKLQGEVPSPEVAVSYYTTNLSSGSTRTFPSMHVGYPGSNFRFTLENKGTTDLHLDPAAPIHLAGPDSLDYILDQSGVPATLAPGAFAYFYVSFKPTSYGMRTAKLIMTTNDLDENPYTLNLSGTGLFPDIDVQQSGISLSSGAYNFGTIAPGSNSQAVTFYVANVGYSPLTFYSSPIVSKNSGNMSEFTIVQSSVPATLQPGASAPFTITFSPLSAGEKSLVLRINSSDVDEYSYTFTVTGNTVAAGGASARLAGNAENKSPEPAGVSRETSTTASVFPNPSKHSFTIYVPSDERQSTVRLRVYNMMGEQLVNDQLMTDTQYNKGEEWAPGMYLIVIGTREVIKVVKE